MSSGVDKAAESFLNAWDMGCFYKLVDAMHHEIDSALKSGHVSRELYESTREKAEALRKVAKSAKNDALKLKASNQSSELESYLKKMEVLLDSKA